MRPVRPFLSVRAPCPVLRGRRARRAACVRARQVRARAAVRERAAVGAAAALCDLGGKPDEAAQLHGKLIGLHPPPPTEPPPPRRSAPSRARGGSAARSSGSAA